MKWNILRVLGLALIGLAVLAESPTPRVVDLEEFLNMVASHSREILMTELDRANAEAIEREARSSVYPQVFMGSSYRRNLRDTHLYIDFPDENGDVTLQKFKMNTDNVFGFEAITVQNVFSFAINAALDAAEDFRNLTHVSTEAQRREILYSAKKAFFALMLLDKRVEVLQAAQDNAQENAELMHKRYDHGQVSQYALLQAEVRWQEAIPQTSQAKRDLSLAFNQVKTLAGVPLDEVWQIRGNLDDYPHLPKHIELDDALTKRFDFQTLLAQKKLTESQVRVESAQAKPSVQADATYTFSSQSDSFSLDRQNHDWNVGLTVSIPVFQGGRIKAKIKQAEISAQQTQLQIEKSKDDIATELSDVGLRLAEARQRIDSENKRWQTAKKGFSIAETSAESGLITQLELRESRVYLDSADLAYANSILDYILAYVDWQRAVGLAPTDGWPTTR